MNIQTTQSSNAFAALGLGPSLVRALEQEGYGVPTPIQAQAIPHVRAACDLLGCAQTGTGKTAAFVLPILQRLGEVPRTGNVRCLILAPTRELAAQIGERVSAYGRHLALRHVVIYGGVGQRAQEEALRRKPDILIATPGRLLDLVKQGFVSLSNVEIFVLDEADRMLDMGFIHDVRRVVKEVPKARQTLLFSATMPRDIAQLANDILVDPVRVSVAPQSTTAEKVAQIVYFVPKSHKRALLEKLLRDEGAKRTIVFTRTKHGANRLSEQLTRSGLESAAIHGNKSQGARERALEGFRTGTIAVLVATDLAARGIDVDGITHVVNFELPNVPEQYVHRIGRTGRAGAAGRAIALCDEEERSLLVDIEKVIRVRVPVGTLPAFDVVPERAPQDTRGPRRGEARDVPHRSRDHRPAQEHRPRPAAAAPNPNSKVGGASRDHRPTDARVADTSSRTRPEGARRRRRRYRGAKLPSEIS